MQNSTVHLGRQFGNFLQRYTYNLCGEGREMNRQNTEVI